MRVTVILTASADGRKSKPFVIFKRKRPLPNVEKAFPQLNLFYNTNGWMDDSAIANYLSKTFGSLCFT